MYLIVGLGNPGIKYRKTPHNAGFMTLTRLARKLGVKFRKQGNTYRAKALIGGEEVVLLKPLTYMNRSGEAVAPVAEEYLVPNEKIVVVYDDKDLNLGKVRIRAEGHSVPSHNGLKSVIAETGGNDFPRVRFGIGRQAENQSLMEHVLHHLSREEMKEYEKVADYCADACIDIVRNGIDHAQQVYSMKT